MKFGDYLTDESFEFRTSFFVTFRQGTSIAEQMKKKSEIRRKGGDRKESTGIRGQLTRAACFHEWRVRSRCALKISWAYKRPPTGVYTHFNLS